VKPRRGSNARRLSEVVGSLWLLVASKYHPIPGFAEKRKGHIVLQDHGDDVWFRNIKLRELPSQ